VGKTKKSPRPELRVFEPESPREAVEGWALHATRRRMIHEQESRRLQHWHYALGTISACLAAVAGTSAFAAWQTGTKSIGAAVATACVGIGAAIIANALTFISCSYVVSPFGATFALSALPGIVPKWFVSSSSTNWVRSFGNLVLFAFAFAEALRDDALSGVGGNEAPCSRGLEKKPQTVVYVRGTTSGAPP
jgi:hypothetical protein